MRAETPGVVVSQLEVAEILDRHGLIGRQEHPELARILDWLRDQGRLVPVLPGWYVRPVDHSNVAVRMQAIARADPDCVVIGRAAASATFWPRLRVETVEVAVAARRSPCPGYRFLRRRVPPELLLVHGGVRLTTPALTALDLIPDLGGDAIDQVLRSRAADLTSLHEALQLSGRRRGNAERARALLESRDNAWSAGERRLHAILHAGHLEAWLTNFRVEVEDAVYYLDVAFRAARLAIEVDGWEWHARRPPDFAAFLRRHTALEASGWRVLHFGWEDLEQRPDWVLEKVVQALASKI